MHKLHFFQDIYERRVCQHSSTPTSLVFGDKSVRFEDHISGRSKISFASAKLRDVLQLQIHGQEIIRLSMYRLCKEVPQNKGEIPKQNFYQIGYLQRRME